MTTIGLGVAAFGCAVGRILCGIDTGATSDFGSFSVVHDMDTSSVSASKTAVATTRAVRRSDRPANMRSIIHDLDIGGKTRCLQLAPHGNFAHRVVLEFK